MSKQSNNYSAQIEAFLFTSSQAMTTKRIAKSLDLSEAETQAGLDALGRELEGRGICLIKGADGYELAVAAEYNSLITSATAQSAPTLSQSSLEVLTIIAFDGPVAKSTIDAIRGTSSDSSLRALLSRDLVKASSKSGADGPQYDLTSLAWRSLGLTGRKDLPKKPKVNDATE